jgi:GNAT superfamily N-acetyltransferase
MRRVSIRAAAPGDEAVIVRFIRELAEYERAPGACFTTEALVREALFGAGPAAECLIGAVDGRPVGFAVFFHNFSTWLSKRGMYLEDLYVTPEARGLGVGKALLCRAAAIARSRGCERFDWMVLDWNTPAIEFYRSLGAEPMSEWTVFRLSGAALERVAAGGRDAEM